jgi:hypothetical protein
VDASSTAPLWQEVQNVVVDPDGHYTVLLGAARSEGLPDGLFTTNDARWLGIRVESEQEQPRAILAAVPYALKAADAETLGGKPLSAFVLNEAAGQASTSHGSGISPTTATPGTTIMPSLAGAGTTGRVAMWVPSLDGQTLGDSRIFSDETNHRVGIDNFNPRSMLHVGSALAPGGYSTANGIVYLPSPNDLNEANSGVEFQSSSWGNGFGWKIAAPDRGNGNAPLSFAYRSNSSAWTELMTLRMDTQRVGIGVNVPQAPLQIGSVSSGVGEATQPGVVQIQSANDLNTGPSGLEFKTSAWTNGFGWKVAAPDRSSGNAPLSFAYRNNSATWTEMLTLRSDNGRVGINNPNPSQMLDVNGNINASGNLTTVGNVTAAAFSGPLIGNVTGDVSGSAASFSGNLAGDVTGAQGATVVSKLAGRTLSVAAPTDGQLLAYNLGSNTWTSRNLSGDVTGGATNTQLTSLWGRPLSAATPTNGQALVYNSTLNQWSPGPVGLTNVQGTLPVANGGTGVTAAGSAGNYLRSNGSAWTTSAISAADITSGTLPAARLQSLNACCISYAAGYGNNGISVDPAASGSAGGLLKILAGNSGAGTNLAGGTLNLGGGNSTGSAGSEIDFQIAVPGTSGTGANSAATRMVLGGNGDLGIGIGTTPTTHSPRVRIFGRNSFTGAGTISVTAGSTTVTGMGTSFLTQVGRGDWICPLTCEPVVQISSDTSLATAYGFLDSASGATYTVEPAALYVDSPVSAYSLVVSGNGAVGIGSVAPPDRLQVVGDIRVGTSGTNGCLKNYGGTALTGTCSSDGRLKTQIQPLSGLLNKVARLQPISFHWRRTEFPQMGFGPERNLGLVAQQVEEVMPELIGQDEHGFKAVHYHYLPILLLEAVRELKAERDALQKQVNEQEERLERLEKLVNRQH